MKVLRACEETKTLDFEIGSVFSHNTSTSWNLMYNTSSQGTGSHQFIGEKYVLQGISVKLHLDNVISSTQAVSADQNWKVYILAAKAYRSTTSLSATDMYDMHFGNNTTDLHTFDSDKVKILAKKDVKIRPATNSFICAYTSAGAPVPTTTHTNGSFSGRQIKLYKKLNKVIRFKDITIDADLKGWNYYILIQSTNDAGISTACNAIGQVRLYIKDC